MDEEKIDSHEWHFFLAGGSPVNVIIDKDLFAFK